MLMETERITLLVAIIGLITAILNLINSLTTKSKRTTHRKLKRKRKR